MHAIASILPLSVRELSFAINGTTIIDNLSFELHAGARTIILGAHGAGKSILLRLCPGLLTPKSGTISWRGGYPAMARKRQAMVFQRPVMLRRSAYANLDYALQLTGMARDKRELRIRAALDKVGLGALGDRSARVLSGGEQQRLALARAWALQPEVLFLDEPTASLDPTATRAVEEIIAAIHADGTKIVMTTHNLGQARRLGDEILFLHRGRLVERAPVETFFNNPATPESAAFIKGELPW
jgi:tungstate transport system ATP-binding protein